MSNTELITLMFYPYAVCNSSIIIPIKIKHSVDIHV